MILKTITFCSFKGGTGKTTTALNVGCFLAYKKHLRTLLVDMDPQANLSTSLGVFSSKGVRDVLSGKVSIKEVIVKTKEPNIDLLPSSTLLEVLRIDNGFHLFPQTLIQALDSIATDYDFCVLDTPPSLGFLVKEALSCADGVVLCITPEPYSILGVQKMNEFLQANFSTLPTNYILGLAISFWDNRTSTNQDYINVIRGEFGEKPFLCKIRRDISISRAILQEAPVFKVFPKSRGAADLGKLSEELFKSIYKEKYCEQSKA